MTLQIYQSWYKAVEQMPVQSGNEFLRAIAAYFYDDTEADKSADWYVFFLLVKDDLDAQKARAKRNADRKRRAEEKARKSHPRPPAKKFVKPTVQEVKAYCDEKGYSVDAEAFVAFYESKGWKVGAVPMKEWRMAVVTWQKNGYGNGRTNKSGTLWDKDDDISKYIDKL